MSYDWLHSDNHPQSLELAAGNWLGTPLPFLFRFSWCHSKNVQTIVLLRVSGQKCSCKWRLCHVHRLPGLHPTKCKSIVICHHQPEKPYSCVFQEMYEHRNLGLHNWCDLHNYSSIRRLRLEEKQNPVTPDAEHRRCCIIWQKHWVARLHLASKMDASQRHRNMTCKACSAESHLQIL